MSKALYKLGFKNQAMDVNIESINWKIFQNINLNFIFTNLNE